MNEDDFYVSEYDGGWGIYHLTRFYSWAKTYTAAIELVERYCQ